MANIFKDGVYIIVGNHDIFGKNTNEVNSLKSIKWIPGINIFEEPISLVTSNSKILMMPWRKDEEEDKNFLDSAESHDILCCHTSISGLKLNKYVNDEEGVEINSFSKFKKVYSGHIHYSQKSKNVNMLGSPYELTRSDMDNKKSITLLDLENMTEEVFENVYSPKFKRIFFKDLLEMNLEETEPLFKNNYVDILIDPSLSLKSNLSLLTDLISSQRSLNFHPYDPDQATTLSEQMLDIDGRQFSVLDFIKEYVKNLDDDEQTKESMVKSLFKLYSIVSKQEQEQKIL
jgi:DNA repair exonuclease SbcCD nuclease subunit